MLISTSKTVALCSFSNLINSADRAIMPIAIVQMANEFKWDMRYQGWILSAFPIGYFSSQIIGGSFSKRFGGKNVLTFAVLLWSLLTFLTPLFASSVVVLIISRIMLGVAEGVGLPAVVQIFSTCVMVEERSRAFSYLVAFGSIGQTVAAILAPHLSWRYNFLTFGCFGFLWIIFWILSFKEIKLTEDDEYIIVPPKNSRIIRWVDYFTHSSLWSIYIAHFSMNWTSYLITVWLPTYLSKNFNVSSSALSLAAVPYIMNSLFGIISGHFADSLIVNKWSVLSVRRLMTCIGLIGPSIFLLFFINTENLLLAIIMISSCMALLSCNSCGHLANHLDVAPQYSAISFGISNTLATIPAIICGPLTAELVLQSNGRWFPVFAIAIAMNFVGSIIYYSHSTSNQIL